MTIRNFKRTAFRLISNVLIAVTIGSSALAQSGTSKISGTVTDQTGARVPGATVTIKNVSTGFKRSVSTGADGGYSFPGIPPATYRLEVEAANFKKAVSNSVQALVDSSAQFNVELEPGEVTATVDITGNTIESVVNTQDASIGNTFVPEQITQLPTNLRRVNDLLTLQPGVTRQGYSAGARSDQSNITLDGIDINDQQTGGRTAQFSTSQASALRLTTESVGEFRITTTNANANQGRSSGSQISLVTKSGTNDFHGALFYFYRPTAFSANDFFNNSAGTYAATDQAVIDGNAVAGDQKVPRPSLARDVFGGAIGGPIKKDKLFFFYSYEGQREASEVSFVRVVPLPSLGQGQVKFLGTDPMGNSGPNGVVTLDTTDLNAIYPVVGLNPAALAVLADAAARYPANDRTVGDSTATASLNTAGFRFNAPITISQNTHIARFDFNISDSQQLFVRGNYEWDISEGNRVSTTGQAFPDTPAPTIWSHPYGLVVGHNWTIGNNMINNFRYGLTRQSFTTGGDTNGNRISFRFVYTPLNFTTETRRVTPVHNFTDDFTWIKGDHTVQFGGNVRFVRNHRITSTKAFDTAVINPSFYGGSGRAVSNPISNAGYTVNSSRLNLQAAASAVIGRFSQYTANYSYGQDGSLLPAGTPADRNFATEEYDFYIQDSYKPFRNLTLTLGVRYGLSRPVYETNGFQVAPTEPLGEIFDRRVSFAKFGVPYDDPIVFQEAGPVNNAPGFYPMDWNNVQPSIAVAWSPDFKGGFLGNLFGKQGESTFRGGFRIVNDYFGQQLAVGFDALSTLGFTTSNNISANTYDVTGNPGPLFTSLTQDVRSLPGVPEIDRFATPNDGSQRIETSLDSAITTPIHYTWNVSYGRSLPAGMYVEASYVGRVAKNLFASRDIFGFNNIVDPASGADWYTAAGQLHDLYYAGTDVANVPAIPFFENLFPTMRFAGLPTATQSTYWLNENFALGDWTFLQLILDDRGSRPNLFIHPQYAAFSAFGTVASSDYHGGSVTLRQRLDGWLSYDLNYTYSKSMDDASGLQTGGSYGSGLILNAIRQQDSRAVSDFDVRHVLNANFVAQLPIGKGRRFFSDMNPWADALVGGWQMSGVIRYNTGLPIGNLIDLTGWATNWNVRSAAVRTAPIQSSPTRGENGGSPNLFADPSQLLTSVRLPKPGETGDRNVFRGTGYSVFDAGLSKTFTMPWSENHKFQVRWEVFNVLNQQYFTALSAFSINPPDPFDPINSPATLSSGTGDFTATKGSPRSMQFAIRYSF